LSFLRRGNCLKADRNSHRKEGDEGNADHWYCRASKPVCREPLGAE
jgi:hypothetical protein